MSRESSAVRADAQPPAGPWGRLVDDGPAAGGDLAAVQGEGVERGAPVAETEAGVSVAPVNDAVVADGGSGVGRALADEVRQDGAGGGVQRVHVPAHAPGVDHAVGGGDGAGGEAAAGVGGLPEDRAGRRVEGG